jgi:hypothetical protein
MLRLGLAGQHTARSDDRHLFHVGNPDGWGSDLDHRHIRNSGFDDVDDDSVGSGFDLVG